MTDEPFLSRWSRRKRAEARGRGEEEAATPRETKGPPPSGGGSNLPAPATPLVAEDEPDLSDLPPIELIRPDTDVTGFFRKGVPAALREAALRRAWATDPVIGTFVEMADYDWDFNTPGGNQIFGPLDPSIDVAAMAEKIFGTRAAAPEDETAGRNASPAPAPENAATAPPSAAEVPEAVADASDAAPSGGFGAEESLTADLQLSPSTEIPQGSKSNADAAPQQKRRRHGAALPG